MNVRVQIVEGDITTLQVQGIVNAANESLLGGAGVDGAIHRAAGPRLLAHNRTLGGCPTGQARITPAFDLEARGVRSIIHTVGPVWGSDPMASDADGLGERHEDVLLASCYAESLRLAREAGLQSLAFPCISTGVYGFPQERAARIASGHVRSWLQRESLPERVVFCCFRIEDAHLYRRLWNLDPDLVRLPRS